MQLMCFIAACVRCAEQRQLEGHRGDRGARRHRRRHVEREQCPLPDAAAAGPGSPTVDVDRGSVAVAVGVDRVVLQRREDRRIGAGGDAAHQAREHEGQTTGQERHVELTPFSHPQGRV